MDLSVIIPCFNRIDLTRACLASLPAAAGNLKWEGILIDNGSTDDTPRAVNEEYSWAEVIRNEENRGFSAAVNQGLSRARGRYLLVVNNDARALPGSLEEAARFLDRRPEVGIVSPQLVREDGQPQNSIANLPTLTEIFVGKWILRTLLPARYPSKHVRFVEPAEVESILGAAMMIRREVIEGIGGLDEGFFFFLEDTDYCRRAREAGWKIYLLPGSRVVHLQGGTANQDVARKSIEYTASLFRYFRKYHPIRFVLLRALYPIKTLLETLFVGAAAFATLGLLRTLRRRLREKTANLWWQVRGRPEGAGLRDVPRRPARVRGLPPSGDVGRRT